MAHTKPRMIELIEQLHQICSSNNPEFAHEKYFYIFLTVNFLGQDIGNNTIEPISSRSRNNAIFWINEILLPNYKQTLLFNKNKLLQFLIPLFLST